MFVSFEGIDGSGKSTQAKLLAEALRKRGHEVVEVREPGATELGERVRFLLLDPSTQITNRAELLLFLSARAQMVEAVVRPALSRGALVVADRFADSSIAYQGGGRALSEPGALSLDDLNRFATGGCLPNRTYLIDLTVSEAIDRMDNRSGPDRLESNDPAFYERVRAAYLKLAAAEPQRIVKLEGSKALEDVHRTVLKDVEVLLG